jgi:hypothetical protein
MICKRRFDKPAAEIAQRYGESVSFDYRLYGSDKPKGTDAQDHRNLSGKKSGKLR